MNSPLITYSLAINEESGSPIIERELLKYRRGSKGQPWHFLDFSRGDGQAVTNEPDQVTNEQDLHREHQVLKSPIHWPSRDWRSSRSFRPPWHWAS